MLIEIVNWEKYNPRHDVKSTSWFRVENTFWADPALTPLDCEGKMVWMTLLSFASQRQGGVIDVDTAFIGALLRVVPSKVDDTLKHFQKHGIIKIPTSRKRNVRGSTTSRPRTATDGRTDGTDGTDERTNGSAPHSAADLATAQAWLDHAITEMPWMAKRPSWTVEAFADALSKVSARLELTDGDLRAILEFVRTDEFWRSTACSPEGLLNKSKRNGQRKIDNILVQMRAARPKSVSDAEAIQRWANQDTGGHASGD